MAPRPAFRGGAFCLPAAGFHDPGARAQDQHQEKHPFWHLGARNGKELFDRETVKTENQTRPGQEPLGQDASKSEPHGALCRRGTALGL